LVLTGRNSIVWKGGNSNINCSSTCDWCCLVSQSKYITVFVLLDISESPPAWENLLISHVKAQNTFWLPWFIS
jgi:hypothetical protein